MFVESIWPNVSYHTDSRLYFKLDTQASVDEFDLSAVFGKITFWSEAKGVEIEFPIDLDRNASLSRRRLGYSTPA